MNKKIKIKQDGIGFYSIADGDASDLLMQADEGEIVLFAALPRHSASLISGFGINRAMKGQRTTDSCLVPMMPRDAGGLIFYDQVTIRTYLAVPPDTPESHPWYGHYFVLDEPQSITLKQVYFRAGLTEGLGGKVHDVSVNQDPPWANVARRKANEYLLAWRNAGYEPTGEDAALYVEGEFSNLNVFGAQGKVLDRATIKKEALTGITGRKRGARSKKPKVPDGQRGRMPEK
jgi:hypothetical protein